MAERHYSKCIVEFPDNPSDPPYAIVHIDCLKCGTSEIRIHVSHLGTVLRTLDHTVNGLMRGDGFTDHMDPTDHWLPSTNDNRRKVREHLDRNFPGWVAGRMSSKGNA